MGQAPASASAPSTFGRYETLFRIASGGMAEVYAARVRGEAGFQKLVALKRMLPHLTDDDRFATMFMDEGRLAAHISSPNVVSTLDLGRSDDGSLYLVMELVVGTTLSNLLRNCARAGVPMSIPVGVEILVQAAQGLHDAHEARTPIGAPLHIVHRDISPQNILLGTDGRVRITDFGVARAILRRTKTSTGELKGKLSYFSPEQCADVGDLDRRSDVFSLGVVAWETLTTRRLFHAENPLAVLERVTRMPIPSAHTVNPAVPEPIAQVIAHALERNRDKRYASALDFARALRDAARSTVGDADASAVSAMVAAHGGESLEWMQRQLRSSLTQWPDRPSKMPALDDTPTEISSDVIPRADDPPAAVPLASMISSTGASFVSGPAGVVQHPTTPAKPSALPVVLVTLIVGGALAAGAAVGIIALTTDDAPPPDTIRVLPAGADPIDVPAVPPESTPPMAEPEPEEAPPPEEPPPEPRTRRNRRAPR
jgi:serine/threonine-protein kinase